MISNGNVKSKDYYTKEFMKDDYYNKSGNQVEGIGQWSGKGCSKLNLNGEVKPKDFWKFLDGMNPKEKEQKLSPYVRNEVQNKDPESNKAQDFVFNANKDFTLLCEIYADNPEMSQKLDDIFNQANEHMNREIEARLTTRIDGKHTPIAGAIVATWKHQTARQVNGQIDPHRHAHNVYGHYQVAQDGTFKAVDFKRVFEDKLLIASQCQEILAKGVKDLGFELEEGKTGWQVKAISDEVRKEFSSRSEKIKSEVGADASYEDRQKSANQKEKKGDYQLDELKSQWKERLDKNGLTKDMMNHVRSQPGTPQKAITKEDILRRACQVAKSSNFTSRHIDIALAQKSQVHDFDKKQMKAEIFKDKNLVKTDFKSKDGQSLYYSKSITSKSYQEDMKKIGEANTKLKSLELKNKVDMQKGGLERSHKPKASKPSNVKSKQSAPKQPQQQPQEQKSSGGGSTPKATKLEAPQPDLNGSGGAGGGQIQAPLSQGSSVEELLSSIKSLEQKLFSLKLDDPKRYEIEEQIGVIKAQMVKAMEEKAKQESQSVLAQPNMQKEKGGKQLERKK
jgi:conjugative relaxase-like TrwC/TraI family protein